jgi:hypothetical protein
VIVPLALLATALGASSQQIGEICTGTETVQIGARPAKTVPYALTFSADLKSGVYCYDRCGKDQSYTIADPAARPIKLADIDRSGTVRRLIFDPASGRVSDYQLFDAGLGPVRREAVGTCKAAAFHQPWSSAK